MTARAFIPVGALHIGDNYPAENENSRGSKRLARAAVVKGKPGTSLNLYSYVRHPNRTGLPARSLDRRKRGSMHRMLCETLGPIQAIL